MNRGIAVLFALILAGCATHLPRPETSVPRAGPPPIEAWARVLERFVDDAGRVDFSALARNRADLDTFVAYVYDHGPATLPAQFPTRAHALAFHINAYNALAMHQVIEAGIPVSLAGLAKVRFFVLTKVRVGGEAISLYDYENKVIRGFGDARIHMALNCMSVGCPKLPRVPFRAEMLDTQLEAEARAFFADPRQVEVIEAQKKWRVSEILKFFTEDFLAHAPSLLAYVNRYRETPIPRDYRLDFIPYDWTVNRQPGR